MATYSSPWEGLENTQAWSQTKPITSQFLEGGAQMLAFQVILNVTGSEKAQDYVEYETLGNFPVNICLIRIIHFTNV